MFEFDPEPVDVIVVAGDVIGGPLVREALQLDDALLAGLAALAEQLVGGRHTPQQLVRSLRPGVTYANPGSVGMPYERRTDAYWTIVIDGAR